MKQFVECGSENESKKLLERIKKETDFKWNGGVPLDDPYILDATTIGFDSGDDGITQGWSGDLGKRVPADYLILSLKIYELKQKRKALKNADKT